VRLVEWPGGIERVRVPLPRRLPAPGGHEYTSIRFPALRDSADRTYRLAIERHGPPEEGTLAIWGRVSSAVGGAASVLAYRAWHRVTGWAALSTLGDRLRAALRGAPGVAAAGALVLAYGASLFCLLGLLRADPG
jgi:hypothetical protein